ncbi:MAG: glycosyltransferase [Candidatus Rokubacteria bacterium]|nr:glycosyltransferase [Candidatus Rokubacteria bacterium]
MRLALFTDSNIFYGDGIGRIVQELMKYVKGHAAHSLIVFHRGDGEEKAEPLSPNVVVSGVAAPHLGFPTYDAYPFLYLLSPRRRLLARAREFRPDAVLTISPYLPLGIGRSALYVAEKLGAPLIGSFDIHIVRLSEHLMGVTERYGRKVPRIRWAARLWLRCTTHLMKGYEQCSRILVPSRFVWEHVAERYGASKCVMFPRGVDTEAFSPRYRDESWKPRYGIEGKVGILYTGRVSAEKNLHTLVDLYGRLKATDGNVALVLVGDGPHRKRIKKLGIPHLVLTGALYGEELSQAYASADLFAFPSQVDAGPMVIPEAMASGLPVVVFAQGGAGEAVTHGETGFVARDVEEFSECIDRLIRNRQLRSSMGAKARTYAEGQSWGRIFDELFAALEPGCSP